ncbi:hypothetical protein [Mycolicibacterium brisbanense]
MVIGHAVAGSAALLRSANAPVQSFLNELCSAKWLANVGVPLAVALVSLVVAVALVRTQLRHDRKLRQAERYSEVATELGWALREVGEALDRIDGCAALTTEREWNGLRTVSRATYRAHICGVPDDDGALGLAVDLSRDMYWRWRCGIRFADRQGDNRDKGLLGIAVVDCLHQPKVLLNGLAKKFIQWDGRGSLPTLSADEIGLWSPVSLPPTGPTREDHLAWQTRFETEYFEKVARLDRAP